MTKQEHWHQSYLRRKQRRLDSRLSRRRNCVICGSAFNNYHTASKMCSELCRYLRRAGQGQGILYSPVKLRAKMKRCKGCGQVFCAANDRFDYCAQACQKPCVKKPPTVEQQTRWNAHRKTSEYKRNRVAKLKIRLAIDPCFKLRGLVSKQVARALKKLKSSKRDSILIHLPYSIPQLKAHLESQFDNRNGFTWENHGKLWHIDHIIPQVMFHYTEMDSKAFRDCWALSNLRPLHKTENMRKSDKLLVS